MQAYMASAQVLCEYDRPTPFTNTPAIYKINISQYNDPVNISLTEEYEEPAIDGGSDRVESRPRDARIK
jgi:hypothetical protein